MRQQFNPKRMVVCCGTGNKTSINEIFNVFCKKYNKNWTPNYADARKGDIIGSISDNKKMMDLIEKRELIKFENGVNNL